MDKLQSFGDYTAQRDSGVMPANNNAVNVDNQQTVDYKARPQLNQAQQQCKTLIQAPSNCFALAKADGSVDLGAHLHTAIKDTLDRVDVEDRRAILRDLWPVFAPMINNAIMGNSK